MSLSTMQHALVRTVCVLGLALGFGAPARAQYVEYIHTDALGSPVAVTDSNRVLLEHTDYEPYGKVLNHSLHDEPGYAGHVSDSVTGLSYMQQRYYDTQLGRFIGTDPVAAREIGDNFNRYSYASSNPYRFKDFDGRESGGGYATGEYTMALPSGDDLAESFTAMADAVDELTNNLNALGPYGGFEERAIAMPVVAGLRGAARVVEGAQVTRNATQGAAAEAKVAKEVVNEGRKLLGSRVAARTSAGLRVIDHLTQDSKGVVGAVEVKSGNAVRNARQIAKDTAMARDGATLVGKNAPDALRGQTLRIETEVRRVPNDP